MKIVHIAPKAPYNDYWGYQDNLLPKYQKKLGHDVTIIVTNTKHENGKIVETNCNDYVLRDGVRVIRLKIKWYGNRALTNMCARMPVYPYLKSIKPDFIFFHSLEGINICDAIRYKKKDNPNCIIVRDNHMDMNNCGVPSGIKGLILREFQRAANRFSMKYVSKVYGVTPWRRSYAEDFYKIPKDKTDVLIMGADDAALDIEHRKEKRQSIRTKYGYSDDDFVVVTGGRIDKAKNIDKLIRACSHLKDKKVKLLVFGNVTPEFKPELDSALNGVENVDYIGWVDSDKVYTYFFAADLIVFPGGHSVMWEQACASKTPCAFNYWEGMEHLNNGGNSIQTSLKTEKENEKLILSLLWTPKYAQLLKVARSGKTDIYRYSGIAKKSLECADYEE